MPTLTPAGRGSSAGVDTGTPSAGAAPLLVTWSADPDAESTR